MASKKRDTNNGSLNIMNIKKPQLSKKSIQNIILLISLVTSLEYIVYTYNFLLGYM